jgi:hypothetical protein
LKLLDAALEDAMDACPRANIVSLLVKTILEINFSKK